jgi:hypothetical protein
MRFVQARGLIARFNHYRWRIRDRRCGGAAIWPLPGGLGPGFGGAYAIAARQPRTVFRGHGYGVS